MVRTKSNGSTSAAWSTIDGEVRALAAEVEQLSTTAMIMKEIPPRPTFVAIRGEFHNHGEEVKPGVPAALNAAPGVKLDRLGLARWLVDPANPLTARVAVNRLWQELFGVGIVETSEEKIPGYLEAVYHLYSMTRKHGPVIIRMRTSDRGDGTHLPSLTSIWRSAEFQEREIFDLYGIHFEGHPDLRRILMWDEFENYPMRKDYREPDDYEWEPTPHDEVLEKAKQHYSPRPAEEELKPS